MKKDQKDLNEFEQFDFLCAQSERARQEAHYSNRMDRKVEVERFEKAVKNAPIEGDGPTRAAIVRSFIYMTIPNLNDEDVPRIMELRLMSLGGETLNRLLISNWTLIQAWMKEVRIMPKRDRLIYIEEYSK